MNMKTWFFDCTFHTPAFLGNAEQSGQWRTPPFKAQLRQWWRVVYAADHQFSPNLDAMRQEEGKLLGNAWLENEFSKSLVRLRLDRWDVGSLKKAQWPADTPVTHPEVQNRMGRTVPVGSALYLGYGPLEFHNGTALKNNAAIQAGESAGLLLAAPATDATRIERALWLMNRYGAVGGRSRNGWGSYGLTPRNETTVPKGELPLRPWQRCLELDWPHAIGQDQTGALIWQTRPYDDWRGVMKRLAELKIGLRTQFNFPNAKPDGNVHDRHWLSYPVTKHDVRDWKRNNLRLPNQLRYKVRPTPDGKLVGVLFHMPHQPPAAFSSDRLAIERVWHRVHEFLDAPAQNLTRIPE